MVLIQRAFVHYATKKIVFAEDLKTLSSNYPDCFYIETLTGKMPGRPKAFLDKRKLSS